MTVSFITMWKQIDKKCLKIMIKYTCEINNCTRNWCKRQFNIYSVRVIISCNLSWWQWMFSLSGDTNHFNTNTNDITAKVLFPFVLWAECWQLLLSLLVYYWSSNRVRSIKYGILTDDGWCGDHEQRKNLKQNPMQMHYKVNMHI